MTPFEQKRSEPVGGDEVIVCPHIAAGNDVGEIKFRYDQPAHKQITNSGMYISAHWRACCQSCLATAGGDGDKINFTQVVTWPVEKKTENDETRRGTHLKDGEKVVVCEHLDPQHPGVRRNGGAIFWLQGKAGEGRVAKESHGAVAIVLCEKCSTKFARDPDSVRTGGTGKWKDETGLPPESGPRVGHLDDEGLPTGSKHDSEGSGGRGGYLKRGDTVAVCEHIPSGNPSQKGRGAAIYWRGYPSAKSKLDKEFPEATAMIVCEKCGPKFAGTGEVKLSGVGSWDGDEFSGTDWPPSEESMKKKATVADAAGEAPKAETGQKIVPPPPGVKLADSVTDVRREEEQRHVMAHGGGGLPPIEESPPKEPERFGDYPPPNAVTDHEAESGTGFEEDNPNQPGPGDEIKGDTAHKKTDKEKHKKGGK